MSTVPDLQAGVLQAMGEWPGEPLFLDLRRVWFCDLAGLRSLWWLSDHAASAGTQLEVRESESIVRVGRLIGQLHTARIA
jgi:anti-anti-sigma regulatory factor